jgi:asparagine synthase (glutamine-hydrolysing)
VAGAAEAGAGLGNGHGGAGAAWRAVQRMETARYMRNQLLRDADWASMAHSIELRVPLVDAELHRRAAAAGCEPARSLGKAELVRRVAPDLPEAVLRRPKTGFYVPVTEWLAPDGDGARHGAAASGQGGRARALARRVLSEFGVELAGGGAAA